MRTRCKVSKVRKFHENEQKSTIVNICSRGITLLHPESTVVITVQHFLATLGVTWADHRRKTCVLEHKGSGTTLWYFPVLTAHLSYILGGTTVNRFWYRCGTTLERDDLRVKKLFCATCEALDHACFSCARCVPLTHTSVHYFHGPGSIPILSLTASRNRCLQPRYFSVVCTETWPSRN
jgi:hypothetical protein